MRLLGKSWLVSALLCFVSTSAFAQTVSDIELGETRQQKAGSASDMYRFTGLTGTTVTATLTTQGDVGLVFYTPDGEEMHSVKGNGTVKLDIILPFPDVYFVSVIRGNAAKAYALKLEGVPPDDHLADFAASVGYERDDTYNGQVERTSQCWVEPGFRVRHKGAVWEQEVTLGRGGMLYTLWKHPDGRTVSEQSRITYDGSKMTWTPISDNRPPETDERMISTRSEVGNFTGYLCD